MRYIGDSVGNVSVWKLVREPCSLVQMKYKIPFSASHGITNGASLVSAVMHIMPQPTAENKRILIIFRDGFIALWTIGESKSIFTTGGNMFQSLQTDKKEVTSACWGCPFGSKVIVGYSNGDVFIWSVSPAPELGGIAKSQTHRAPICRLNLGFKLEKIPIGSLKFAHADGKATRVYILGATNSVSENLLQVVILNDQTESRTVKLGLHLPEPCIALEIISSTNDPNKHKEASCLLLGKSGHIYAYNDCMIERYLLECHQARSPPSLPKQMKIKLPFTDSSITVAKLFTYNSHLLSFTDEEYILSAKNIPPLIPLEMKPNEGTHWNLTNFSGFSKITKLYITGHSDGAIKFWDVSCPFLLPILSVNQQSEEDFSLSGIALTALYFNCNSQILVSGDQSGTVRIFKFKPEPFPTENSFSLLQGSTKRGRNRIFHNIKLVKVNGAVLSIDESRSTEHLAIGSDQGYVSLVDIEEATLLYQNYIATELCRGVNSVQFETCTFHGFQKNLIVAATKDSSVVALDRETGNLLSTKLVRPKKPSRSLYMQILGSNISGHLDLSKGHAVDSVTERELLVLLCSEKAIYVYSLMHIVQGVKKVLYKKKFHSLCFWASTFYTSSDLGLVLFFACGKIEIRSVPDLYLIKEAYIRGFALSGSNVKSSSEISICSSSNGELIMVNGDDEIYFASISVEKEANRLLNHVGQVYNKDLMVSHFISGNGTPKEKKKGVFVSVIRDMKGSTTKRETETQAEDLRGSIEELSSIFAIANFPSGVDNTDGTTIYEDMTDLNIDDIDLEDTEEKPVAHNMTVAVTKQNLTSKFQAFKGKLKHMKARNEKLPEKKELREEKAGAVDQIKKKYGFPASGESSVAKMAESKLHDNLRKLQGVSLRTTEMQNTAKSFSSMAKELLRTAEQDRRSS